MENIHTPRRSSRLLASGLSALTLTSLMLFTSGSLANENPTTEKTVEEDLNEVEKSGKERLKKERGRAGYKRVTLSEDKSYYTIDGKEELGPNPVDDESFYVKYSKKKYEGDYAHEDDYDEDSINYRLRNFNERDGFYLAYSAVSSSGDDLNNIEDQTSQSFDTHFSYRIQLLGLFVESPGLNSRRLHGLYASNAWGINFYSSDNWSFDIYKQTDTEKVEGLSAIQNRSLGKRAGVRATGYFDNSQLQFIYSPYNSADTEDDGIEASLSYTHYWQLKNWNIYGSLGAQYQSKEIVDFYQPNAEVDQSRINTSAELGLEYALNKDWVLGAFASYNELPSQRASIAESTSGSRAGLLLTFVF